MPEADRGSYSAYTESSIFKKTISNKYIQNLFISTTHVLCHGFVLTFLLQSKHL